MTKSFSDLLPLYKWPAIAPRHPLITRFAPSPTGFLHLGHVRNALFVWGIAELFRAKVLLRIEDHDRGRCRPAFEDAILEDLRWLGFFPQGGLSLKGESPSNFRQSDHLERYEEVFQVLKSKDLVYPCVCTRKDLENTTLLGAARRYPGTCAEQKHSWSLVADGHAGIRMRIPPMEVSFVDGIVGEQNQNLQSAFDGGDVLIRERTGYWTYQFAVVVDDIFEGVNTIVRGQDLLSSTGRQIVMRRIMSDLLGMKIGDPVFFHHALILDENGQKLSKRMGATAVSKRREAGELPESILSEAVKEI